MWVDGSSMELAAATSAETSRHIDELSPLDTLQESWGISWLTRLTVHRVDLVARHDQGYISKKIMGLHIRLRDLRQLQEL